MRCVHFSIRCRVASWTGQPTGQCLRLLCATHSLGSLQAGAVAQQAVSQMRTVAAYNGEERALQDYDNKLERPLKVRGARKGAQCQGLMAGHNQCRGGL